MVLEKDLMCVAKWAESNGLRLNEKMHLLLLERKGGDQEFQNIKVTLSLDLSFVWVSINK